MTEQHHSHEHQHQHQQQQEHEHSQGQAHSHGHSHSHSHTQTKNVANRLAKAAGHLEKVRRMVEEGEDCSQVLIQLAAVRAALSSTAKVILRDHIEHCLYDAAQQEDRQSFDELCQAINQFL